MLGVNDFIEYWSAFELFVQNQNLYDPALMARIQQREGFPAQPPLMMWVPPWALLLCYPFFLWSFQTSALLWLLLNISLCIASSYLLCATLALASHRKHLYALLSLLFVPCVVTLQLGQISCFLLFALSLFLWSLKNNRLMLAGLALSVLSLKPHLFLIFCCCLLFWILRIGYFTLLLSSFCSFGLLLLGTQLIASDALYYWWQSVVAPLPGAPEKLSWITPTLVGISRLSLADGTAAPLWPTVFIPACGLLCSVWYFCLRPGAQLNPQQFPLLIGISFCFSPFAWIFDAVVLLPLFLMCTDSLFKRGVKPLLLITVVALSQVFILLLQQTSLRAHHQMFWFAPLLLILFILSTTSGENETLKAER